MHVLYNLCHMWSIKVTDPGKATSIIIAKLNG